MYTRWTINITPAERDACVVLGSLAAVAGGALLFAAASTLTVVLEVLLILAVAANIAGVRAHERAAELLERVGLSGRAGARPSQMSEGEQQRVSVARALANDPPVLLADEPTANLDASRGHDLGRLLRQLADDDGRSVVIVSHDDRLREVADRVLWLEDGQFKVVAAMVVDPVCKMQVEPTGAHVVRGDRTLWFCSEGCRREFLDDPARFEHP